MSTSRPSFDLKASTGQLLERLVITFCGGGAIRERSDMSKPVISIPFVFAL